jgi:hypothetical protein
MSTEIMYNIEYHNNPVLLETINNSSFNPNQGLRKKSFIDAAVEYNNFEVFKALITHKKFNYEKLISTRFIHRIFTRTSLADIPENRKYLSEIYDLNLNIEPDYIRDIKAPLFFELFEKINKTNMQCLVSLINYHIKDPTIFEFVFKYIKNNFPATFNKQYIDTSLLSNIYSRDLLSHLIIIKNENYDISIVSGKNAPEIIDHECSKCLKYLANENITYDSDFLVTIENLLTPLNIQYSYQLRRMGAILDILISNLENIKKIYLKFNETESNILKIMINKCLVPNVLKTILIEDPEKYIIINNIDLCCKNFKIFNPINEMICFLKNLKKPFNILNLREIILKLIYYGGNLNSDSVSFLISSKVFTKEEIDIIIQLANDKYKPKEIVIKNKKGKK